MKNLIYLVLTVLLASCGANTKSNYQQAIADYVQTDKSGTKYDLQFKVVELNEIRNITVADSIATLTDEFKASHQGFIDRLELARTMSKDLLKNENGRRNPDKSRVDKYTADIGRINHRIDSLKNLVPTDLKGYDSRNATDVLAVVVRCKYSIIVPGSSVRAEETSDFTLSTDGKHCYRKAKAK